DAAVQIDLAAPGAGLDNFWEHLDCSWHAIELASAVIGDDDACCTMRNSQLSVLAREHTLDEDWQGADAMKPGERLPGECAVEERGDVRGERGGARSTVVNAGILIHEVCHCEMWRQAKAVPHIPLACAQTRHIDGENQGTVSSVLRTAYLCLRDFAVSMHI